jgi:hypothetical protein
MDEYGSLQSTEGITEFSHIPDWYEWERANVRKEILDGKYHIEDTVEVDSLPNAKGFINLGAGHVIHDNEGFTLTYSEFGETKVLKRSVASMEACHIEFDYNGKGDCIDMTTPEDNFYVYFKNLTNIVTKIHFATEELTRNQIKQHNKDLLDS